MEILYSSQIGMEKHTTHNTWTLVLNPQKRRCSIHAHLPGPEWLAGRGSSGLARYYKTPHDFLAEAKEMGISRLIYTVPKGFVTGETWVLLAHRKGVQKEEPIHTGLLADTGTVEISWTPAIFSVFRPTAIEYIVKGNETEGELERIVKRGLTPIEVNPRRAYK